MNGELVTDDEDEVTLAEITSDFAQQTEVQGKPLQFNKQLILPTKGNTVTQQAPDPAFNNPGLKPGYFYSELKGKG